MKKIKLKINLGICFFIICIVLLIISADTSFAAQQNMEQKINMMVNVLAPSSDSSWQRQNKKDAVFEILNKNPEISGNPLVDELINVVLNNEAKRKNVQVTRSIPDKDIEQILDIINPNINKKYRKQKKNIIIQILNNTYNPAEPVNSGGSGHGQTIQKGKSITAFAKVIVSDQISKQFQGANAIDGLENTEWVAHGSRGKWLLLKWRNPVNIKSIGLLGRRQDISVHIWDSDIIFSDGTIIEFGALDAASFRKISVNKKQITWIKYYIRDGKNNVGLSEIEVIGTRVSTIPPKLVIKPQLYPVNLAQEAKISVSSALKNKYRGAKAIDRNPMTEWVAKGNLNQWLRLSWKKAVKIDRIRLKGRIGDSASRINEALLIFSNGSIIQINGGLKAKQTKTIKTLQKKITWVKFYIRKSHHKAGLAEIEVNGKKVVKKIIALNLAQKASARASDYAGSKYKVRFVKDRHFETQWVAKGGRDKWISLEWDQPVAIGKLSITAGKGLENGRILDSVLILSDGSLIPVGKINPGQTKTFKINKSEMWWIKFFIRKGRGKIGVSEIIVQRW